MEELRIRTMEEGDMELGSLLPSAALILALIKMARAFLFILSPFPSLALYSTPQTTTSSNIIIHGKEIQEHLLNCS